MRWASAEDGIKTGDGTGVGFFIPLPENFARLCPSLAPEDHSPPHVTFLYVGEVPEDRTDEFLSASQEAFSDIRIPVRAWLGQTDYFVHPDQDRRVAHMVVHFNRKMGEFRKLLKAKLEDAGFDVQDSWPEYNPHTTLAYLDGFEANYEGGRPHGGWDFDSIEVWGLPEEHEVRFGVSNQRVARQFLAKYKSKTKDDEGNVHYEYGPRQVAERNKSKAEQVEKLRKSITKLRSSVKSGLKSKDDKQRALALAVALMDETYERVGNPKSAEGGHFGVTGWQTDHVKFEGKKAILTYTGKSGVNQRKEVTNSEVVSALKDMAKGKSGDDVLITCEGDKKRCLTSQEVNDYLSDFDITAKDIRGFHANREMVERLKEIRKGGKELPRDRKERDKILKKEFDKALKETAKAVGHEAATLRSNYLVPGLEESFLHDGTVVEKFKQATKSHTEREDEESDRLVRPSPKKKPPRKDKRRETVDAEKDLDVDQGDLGDDPDLSLNYKRVARKKFQSSLYKDHHIGERVGRGEECPPVFSLYADITRRGDKMPRRITKKGAQQVSAELDRVASLMEQEWEALGIPKQAALDVAYRLDLISDFLDQTTGLRKADFDPSQIGEQESGALEADADEPYTKQHFTQQWFREMREKQEAGKIPGADKFASEHGFDLFAE